MNGFAAIAEPTRRRILDVLRDDESDVSGLVARLAISQPLASKHLKVLREAGAVDVRVDGKRRVYRLADEPLPDVLAWVMPYARLWTHSLDRLEKALEDDA